MSEDTRTHNDRQVDEFLRRNFNCEPQAGAPSIPDPVGEGDSPEFHQGGVGRVSESQKTDDLMQVTGHAGDRHAPTEDEQFERFMSFHGSALARAAK